MTASPTLRITYPTRRAVLASYRLDGTTLSLFVPTTVDVPLGSPVRLEVSFGDCSQEFVLRGKVTWRRPESRGARLEPGLGIAFTGGDKYAPAQMLAYCSGRPLDLGTSHDERVETTIPCRVQLGKHSVRAYVRDISNGGAFVATERIRALPAGRELVLKLDPGLFGWGGKTFRAKVVWCGDKQGMPGFGARFVGLPGELRPQLKKYLGRGS